MEEAVTDQIIKTAALKYGEAKVPSANSPSTHNNIVIEEAGTNLMTEENRTPLSG